MQEALKEAQGRLKGLEETENRIKECGYSSVQKQKERNGGGTATQSSQSNGNMAGNTYLIRKLVGKVRESCQLLRDAEEEAEGSQRRKGRENE